MDNKMEQIEFPLYENEKNQIPSRLVDKRLSAHGHCNNILTYSRCNNTILTFIHKLGYNEKKQFADAIGVPESTVNFWINRGRIPSAPDFRKMERATGFSLNELYDIFGIGA